MERRNKHFNQLATTEWEPLLTQEETQIKERLTELRKIIRKWHQTHDSDLVIVKSDHEVLCQYLRHQLYLNEELRFRKTIEPKAIHDQMIPGLDDLNEAYYNFKLFKDHRWKVLFSQTICQKILDMDFSRSISLLSRVSLYSQGYIPLLGQIDSKRGCLKQHIRSEIMDAQFYTETVDQDIMHLIIGLQKVPIFQFGKQKLKQMAFQPYVQIVEIYPNLQSKKVIENTASELDSLYAHNPSRRIRGQKLELDKKSISKLPKNANFFGDKSENKQIEQTFPKIYKSITVSDEDWQDYQFSLHNFSKIRSKRMKKRENEKHLSQEDKLVKIAEQESLRADFSFSSATELVRIYNKIPNDLYKLNNDERNIILSENSNLIVIGRSGTGKTLSALLRLFVIELFYKWRKFTRERKGTFQAEHIEQIWGLKNIFLTASPLLIKEIKKQYEEMKDLIKAEMQKLADSRQNSQQSQIFQEGDIFEEEKDMNLDEFLEEYEEKMNHSESLNDLSQEQFPGFFSVRNFVIMLDGTCKNPMFYRGQNQADNPESNDPQSEELSQKQEESENEDKMQENQDFQEQMEEAEVQGVKMGWKQNDAILSNSSDDGNAEGQEIELTEIDFYTFESQFWVGLPLEYFKLQNQLSAANVWAEIYSVIKGSYLSHQNHSHCLSRRQYLVERKHEIYTLEEKKAIYTIFENYESWKEKWQYYDFMDLVNHILEDIEIHGYNGPLLNYFFIDEVQDLSPATMYLISKLAFNGVFYCGDSAQTIAKGVNFKFKEVPEMFHKKFPLEKLNLQCPDLLQLSINYRSHNEILQLGNSIIEIITKLFEGAIDHLKPQKSDYRGPKPTVMINKGQVQLLELLTEPLTKFDHLNNEYVIEYLKNVDKKVLYELSPQQIFLVRNEEEKKMLPYRLQHGNAMILTFEEVKGLEYDDVVLINFFSSSKCQQKWKKLLRHLDVDFKLEDKKSYDESINKREFIEGHNLEISEELIRDFGFDTKPQLTEDDRFYKVPFLVEGKYNNENIKLFYDLLTELKVLYTAITRARKTFIIYDKFIPPQIQRLWKKMNLIEQINSQEQHHQIEKKIKGFRRAYQRKKRSTEVKEWKKEGFKWYLRKNYDKAILCFRNINDVQTIQRIEAEKIANSATTELKKFKQLMKNTEHLSKEELKIKHKTLEVKKTPINQMFVKAGKIFEEIGRFKNAGECYFSGGDIASAKRCWEKVRFSRGLAYCCEKLHLYAEAAENYEKIKKYGKMLECLSKQNSHSEVFDKLQHYGDKIEKSEQFCIEYGEKYLKELVEKFVEKTGSMSIMWKQNRDLKYQPISKEAYTNATKKCIMKECEQNLKVVVESSLIIKQTKQAVQSLEQQSKRVDFELEQFKDFILKELRPGRNLSISQISQIYKLMTQYKTDKNLQEYCSKINFPLQRALEIATGFNDFSPEYNELIQRRLDISKQLQEKKQKLKDIKQRYGTIKEIQSRLNYLVNLYNSNKISNEKTNLKIQLYNIDVSSVTRQRVNKLEAHSQSHFFDNEDMMKQMPYQSSFLGQSFDDSLDLSYMDFQEQIKGSKCEIFNFALRTEDMDELIGQAATVLKQSGNHINPFLRPPFPEQHHWFIEGKIQSLMCTKYPQLEAQIQVLRKIERIGEFQLCLIICERYQLFDLAKKFIVSRIDKENLLSRYSRKVKELTNKVSSALDEDRSTEMKMDNLRISQEDSFTKTKKRIRSFLSNINKDFMKREVFRSELTKENIVDFTAQSLLLQGFYRNAIDYLNKEKKSEVCYMFMNYNKLFQRTKDFMDPGQPLRRQIEQRQKMNKKRQQNMNLYIFLVEKNDVFRKVAPLINAASMQEMFWKKDSTRDDSILSKNQWEETVELSQRDVSKISSKVIEAMREYEEKKYRKKKEKEQLKEYISHQYLKERQEELNSRQHQMTLLSDELNELEKQIRELRKVQSQIQTQIQEIEACEKEYKFDRDCLENQIIQVEHLIQIFRRQKLRQNKQNEAWKVQLKSQFDLLNSFNHCRSQYEAYSCQTINLGSVRVNTTASSRFNSLNAKRTKLKLDYTKISSQIKSTIPSQIEQKRKGIELYIGQIQEFNQQQKIITNQIQRLEDLQSSQEKELKCHNLRLNELEKQCDDLERKGNEHETQVRRRLFDLEQRKIQQRNKIRYAQKIQQELNNFNFLPNEYKQGYFTHFLQTCLSQQNRGQLNYDLKKLIITVINNSGKQFQRLSNFQLCQILILYLSVICYDDYRFEILCWLYREQNTEIEYHFKGRIRQEIKQITKDIKEIEKKIQLDGGYRELYQKKINRLQQRGKELDYEFRQAHKIHQEETTYSHLLTMINRIKHLTESVEDSNRYRLVDLLLGFFQCRVVQNCSIMWVFGRQYVLIKSTSVLVDQILNRRNREVFFFYFDSNKQTIICRYQTAFRAMLNIINRRHYEFSHFVKEQKKNNLNFYKPPKMGHFQRKTFINISYIHYRKMKQDIEGFELQKQCAKGNCKQLKQLYTIFKNNLIQKGCQSHKQSVLFFYYNRGHSTAESFHFFHYQMKSMEEICLILDNNEKFVPTLLKQMQKKLLGLKQNFSKWKVYLDMHEPSKEIVDIKQAQRISKKSAPNQNCYSRNRKNGFKFKGFNRYHKFNDPKDKKQKFVEKQAPKKRFKIKETE